MQKPLQAPEQTQEVQQFAEQTTFQTDDSSPQLLTTENLSIQQQQPEAMNEDESKQLFENLEYLTKLNRETMHMQDVDMVGQANGPDQEDDQYQVQILDPKT